MHVIRAINVHHAFLLGLKLLQQKGRRRTSRNGEVVLIDGPVMTEYLRPQERVLFWAARDANPFFHFFEFLWMMAGRNDVAFVKQFVKRMADFSDDGQTLRGAYGKRWRNHFQPPFYGNKDRPNLDLPDQLPIIRKRLEADSDDRRCVLTMWDPVMDLGTQTKDACCNTHIYFSRDHDGKLDMTVCCRSNDMIWGGYGANAVHFSFLQEIMAAWINCPIGKYWHLSNNFHVYTAVFNPLIAKMENYISETEPPRKGTANIRTYSPYLFDECKPYPILQGCMFDEWDCFNHGFLIQPFMEIGKDAPPFFWQVVWPMWLAYHAYKERNFQEAFAAIEQCKAGDWRIACQQWLERRQATYKRAHDDGPSHES